MYEDQLFVTRADEPNEYVVSLHYNKDWLFFYGDSYEPCAGDVVRFYVGEENDYVSKYVIHVEMEYIKYPRYGVILGKMYRLTLSDENYCIVHAYGDARLEMREYLGKDESFRCYYKDTELSRTKDSYTALATLDLLYKYAHLLSD